MREQKQYKAVVSVAVSRPESFEKDSSWTVIDVEALYYGVVEGYLHFYYEAGQPPFMSYAPTHWVCVEAV